MSRPPVDVVVPFHGDQQALEGLGARLQALQLGSDDTLLIVDNTPGHAEAPTPIPVLHASERATPGYARNSGAAQGNAPWIVFIDADTDPIRDLLERYFDPPPQPETVLLAGGVRDEEVPRDAPFPARYAYLRRTLSQDRTLSLGRWSFAQSVNLACRRDAFEAVGGFREDIRAAEDADLNYRLTARGGRLERRERAIVVHHNRRSWRAFLAQATLHGGGAAWLGHQYPGALPRRRKPGLVWWGIRFATRGSLRALRLRSRDELVVALLEPVWEVMFELGRSLVRVQDREGSCAC